MTRTQKEYWNDYYNSCNKVSAPHEPSQFAAFTLNEIKGKSTQILDFGCGNGRDSFFFARHGYRVLGIDASTTAVENCLSQGVPGTDFLCSSVTDVDIRARLDKKIAEFEYDDITVYARFFLHAIDEEAQTSFLNLTRALIGSKGRAAFEFRTNRDENQAKITPKHYRRFINPLDFMAAAEDQGLAIRYFVEGFGFAKYQGDDAHVARLLHESTHKP